MVWVCIDWADIQITVFADEDALRRFGKEPSLITCSHRGDFDWLISYVIADNYGFLEVLHELLVWVTWVTS